MDETRLPVFSVRLALKSSWGVVTPCGSVFFHSVTFGFTFFALPVLAFLCTAAGIYVGRKFTADISLRFAKFLRRGAPIFAFLWGIFRLEVPVGRKALWKTQSDWLSCAWRIAITWLGRLSESRIFFLHLPTSTICSYSQILNTLFLLFTLQSTYRVNVSLLWAAAKMRENRPHCRFGRFFVICTNERRSFCPGWKSLGFSPVKTAARGIATKKRRIAGKKQIASLWTCRGSLSVAAKMGQQKWRSFLFCSTHTPNLIDGLQREEFSEYKR